MKACKLNIYLICVFLIIVSGFVEAGNCCSFKSSPMINDDGYMICVDSSITPQQDFFKYVNGTNLKCGSNQLEGFKDFRQTINKCLRDHSYQDEKVSILYTSFTRIGTAAQLENSAKVINDQFRAIDHITNYNQMQEVAANLNKIGVFLFTKVEPLNPSGDKTGTIDAYLLPIDANYKKLDVSKVMDIFKNAKRTDDIDLVMAQKIADIANHFNSQAEEYEQPNQRFEHNFNKFYVSSTPEDKSSGNRPVSEEMLKKIAWNSYFIASGVTDKVRYVKINLGFLSALNDYIAPLKNDQIQAYFKFRFLEKYNNVLYRNDKQGNKDIDIKEDFYSNPGNTQLSSDDHAFAAENMKAFFDAPAAYACFNKYIAENKPQIDEIFKNLKNAYHNGVEKVSWMSPQAKAFIHEKLNAMQIDVDFQSEPKDYSSVKLNPNDPIGNVMRINEFKHNYFTNKLGSSGKHTTPQHYMDWTMYSPSNNTILIPLAALVSPVFDPNADVAEIYGSFGVILGHEISHGLDYYGIQCNEYGICKTYKGYNAYIGNKIYDGWVTTSDMLSLEQILSDLKTQADYYNGRRMSRYLFIEDNADILGLKAANAALDEALPTTLTADKRKKAHQEFFKSFAELFRQEDREELETDSYPIPSKRVNGAVRNVNKFYDVFGIKPVDIQSTDKAALPLSKRVDVWWK